MSNSGIAYQNKDIISKVFAENFKDKSLQVYGLDLPKIVRVLPTNLPQVSANELRIDNLFLLEDDSVAIIDYESVCKPENALKYIGYIHRVAERYFKEGRTDIIIRMIVIFTADVKPVDAWTEFNLGALTLTIEPAYLSELDSEEIMEKLGRKVRAGEKLADEEVMEFIILPLTYHREKQKEAIRRTIELAKGIEDEKTAVFVLSGLLVFSDKVIDKDLSQHVKEWIMMTQVGRLFVQETEQAVEKAREMADAKRMVSIIDNILSKGYNEKEACSLAGVSPIDYENARRILESEEVFA